MSGHLVSNPSDPTPPATSLSDDPHGHLNCHTPQILGSTFCSDTTSILLHTQIRIL